MDSSSFNPMPQVTQETVNTIRESFDLDVKKIDENVDAIEEWCKKQDHLIDALPYLRRDMLERFLILGNGSIEQAKNIIEKVLTLRGMMPEFVQHDTMVFLNEYSVYMDNMLIAPMSKLNPIDNTMVILFRIMNKNFEDISMLTMSKFCSYMLDMRLEGGYVFSDRLIFDFEHVKASIITRLNPVVLKKIETMFVDAYKVRLKGVHMINAPTFMNTVVNILKHILKEKIGNRIYVHDSYEDLYRVISKEVLPKEYGGDLESCREFAEKWKNYFKTEEAKRIIENGKKLISNESRRSTFKFNEEYMGVPGSFKRLDVD